MSTLTSFIVIYPHAFEKRAAAAAISAIESFAGNAVEDNKAKLLESGKGFLVFSKIFANGIKLSMEIGEFCGVMYAKVGGGRSSPESIALTAEAVKKLFELSGPSFAVDSSSEDDTPFSMFFSWASGDFAGLSEWVSWHSYFIFGGQAAVKRLKIVTKQAKTEKLQNGIAVSLSGEAAREELVSALTGFK